MDAPFKVERKNEIGVEMTPARPKKPHYTPKAEGIEDLLKTKKARAGGFKNLFPLQTAEKGGSKADEKASSESSVRRASGQAAELKTGTPRLENAQKTGSDGNSGTGRQTKRFVYKESRRCIVKIDFRGYKPGVRRSAGENTALITKRLAPFVKEGGGTATGAQVGYIGRTGAIEGELFSASGNTIRTYTGAEALLMFSGQPTISVIISPEDPGADLVELAKRFMKDIYTSHSDAEPSFWCAAIHGNTEHRHVHILVSTMGKDQHSESVISRGYVHGGHLQRDTADILTEIQGPRTWGEVMVGERRKKNVLRLTSLDRTMMDAFQPQPDGTNIFLLSSVEETKKEKVSRRLQTLKKHGLVEPSGNRDGVWTFKVGAKERLYRTEYSEHFGLDEKELENSIVDCRYTPPYDGTILETVRTDNKNMLFMIKDSRGYLHLRKERIKSEAEAEKYNSLEEVSVQTVQRGFAAIRARDTVTRGRR